MAIGLVQSSYSREPRLYMRVCLSVGPSVGQSIGLLVRELVMLFFWRAETKTANDLCRVSGLVKVFKVYVLLLARSWSLTLLMKLFPYICSSPLDKEKMYDLKPHADTPTPASAQEYRAEEEEEHINYI